MATSNRAQDIFNVNGLVAVITGGGSGLGAYAARALDANGAHKVYIVGRRKDALEATAKTGVNGTITPIVGDVSSKDSLAQVAAQIRREVGYVNFLFANAGIMGPSFRDFNAAPDPAAPSVADLQRKLWDADADAFNQTFHVNATGVYYTAVAFLDLLDAGNKRANVAQESQILVTSSIAGYSRQVATSVAYNVSKAAVNHLVKCLSTTFAQMALHIRVNLIAPGLYPSEMSSSATAKLPKFTPRSGHEAAFAGAFETQATTTPAGRSGSEEDFAGVILFFASQAGAFLNGETMVSDGGRLSVAPATY